MLWILQFQHFNKSENGIYDSLFKNQKKKIAIAFSINCLGKPVFFPATQLFLTVCSETDSTFCICTFSLARMILCSMFTSTRWLKSNLKNQEKNLLKFTVPWNVVAFRHSSTYFKQSIWPIWLCIISSRASAHARKSLAPCVVIFKVAFNGI